MRSHARLVMSALALAATSALVRAPARAARPWPASSALVAPATKQDLDRGAWDPKDSWVAAAGDGPLVFAWRLGAAEGPVVIDAGTIRVHDIAADAQGRLWTTNGVDVTSWDATTGARVARCDAYIVHLGVGSDGSVWGTSSRTLGRLDPSARPCFEPLAELKPGSPFSLAANDDAVFAFTWVRRWRVARADGRDTTLAFDGSVSLAGDAWAFESLDDDRGRWWSLAGERPRAFATQPSGSVYVAFASLDGRRLVTAAPPEVSLFGVDAIGASTIGPRLIAAYDRPDGLRPLALAPDGLRLFFVDDHGAPGIVSLAP